MSVNLRFDVMFPCASAYLKAHPPVTQPTDLAKHAVLVPGQLVTELRLHTTLAD